MKRSEMVQKLIDMIPSLSITTDTDSQLSDSIIAFLERAGMQPPPYNTEPNEYYPVGVPIAKWEPEDEYLTLEEVADLLNVSTKYVQTLLLFDKIPYIYKDGDSMPYIIKKDASEYKRKMKLIQESALDELSAQLQDEINQDKEESND